SHLCSRGLPGGQALAYLRNPFLSLSLLGQRPPAQNSCPCRPDRKPLVNRDSKGRLCPLLGCLSFPAEPMALCSEAQGISRAEGVRHLLGSGDSFLTLLEGLIWIAKHPQDRSRTGEARHTEVLAMEKSVGAVLRKVIEGNA